jgi:putative membrane protein
MSPKLKQFLQGWVFTTLSVFLTSYILRGIQFERLSHLVMAALLLGILNAFVRPILMVFSLPLLLLTLGLFTFVINAFLLYLVGKWMQPHFQVDSFAYALAGAVLISIFNLVFNILFGTSKARVQAGKSPKEPPPAEPPDTGSGPIIDV